MPERPWLFFPYSRNHSIPSYPPLHTTSSREMESESELEACDFGDRRLALWTSDMYDGAGVDVPSLLASLGQKTTTLCLEGRREIHFIMSV